MGFTPKIETVRLTFEDGHPFAGLEVETRTPDIGRVAGLVELQDYIGAEPERLTEESVARLVGLLDRAVGIFADHLVSWNVETADGEAVPADRSGLALQPDSFVLELVAEWMKGTVGVRSELGKDSTSGPPSPEVSIPMELLSPSRAS